MKSFEWTAASSVDEAIALTVKGAAIKAGGVDVLDMMKEHLFEPTRLVDIREIKDLDYIRDDPRDGAKIGPLVTVATLAEDPTILQALSAPGACRIAHRHPADSEHGDAWRKSASASALLVFPQ